MRIDQEKVKRSWLPVQWPVCNADKFVGKFDEILPFSELAYRCCWIRVSREVSGVQGSLWGLEGDRLFQWTCSTQRNITPLGVLRHRSIELLGLSALGQWRVQHDAWLTSLSRTASIFDVSTSLMVPKPTGVCLKQTKPQLATNSKFYSA